jgi:hypothetical protein
LTRTYPSAYADGGSVSWSKVSSDGHGNLKVSHPRIRWEQLRATEGWAALQHHNVLRTYFTLYLLDEEGTQEVDPLLRVECLQSAYFAILPGDETAWTTHIPEWHMVNVYALKNAPVQFETLTPDISVQRQSNSISSSSLWTLRGNLTFPNTGIII